MPHSEGSSQSRRIIFAYGRNVIGGIFAKMLKNRFPFNVEAYWSDKSGQG
ncbi:MAG: hypothetical protein ACJ70P_00770 [Nitrososphaera sp.]